MHLDATSIWACITGESDALDSVQCSLAEYVAQGGEVEGSGGKLKGLHPWLRKPGSLKVLAGLLPLVWPDFGWPKVLSDEGAQRLPEALAALEGLGFRDYQVEAVGAALSCALGRCVVDVGTGGGKTRIAWGLAYASGMWQQKMPWLYVVHGRDLVRQSRASFASLNEAAGGCQVPIECVGWADKALGRGGFAGIIVDECHGVAARTRAQALCRFSGGWRVGLSGTPLDRTDDKNTVVLGLLGPVAYRIGVDDLTDEGHLTPGRVICLPYCG